MQDLLKLPFMRKAKAGQESQQAAETAADQAEPTDDELKLRLYRLIIDRYRDKIEEYETKSVSDIKGLVQPRHEKIAELRESIT
ncbi:MAG: hypothetical protein QW568_03045, partial [Candidatus Anstonellaceae archaeon]